MTSNTKDIAEERLKEEFAGWQKFHPKNFKAAPAKKDGIDDWKTWNCSIPGKLKSDWAGGVFTLRLEFSDQYPYEPPQCLFDPPIFHPNVYPSGKVALSLLEKDWRPQLTIKQILMGVQLLLDDPNFNTPAQVEAFVVHSQGRHLYDERVREQAKRMTPPVTKWL